VTTVAIRRLGAPHLVALLDHLGRLPSRTGTGFDRPLMRARYGECLASSTRTRCWAVLWGAWSGTSIVGHAEVRSEADEEAPHRGRLSWWLEPGADTRTVGHQLVAAAVAWAIAHPDLEWLDAKVRDDEPDRLSAVRANDFTIVGRVPDRFRIGGQSVGDVLVARKVAAWRGRTVARAGRGDRTERQLPAVGGVLLRTR
jgi:hypothetical protein